MHGIQHSTSRISEIRPMYRLHTAANTETLPVEASKNWDMHLARADNGDRLITRVEHDTLLDRFLRFNCGWSLRLVPQFFLRDLAIATESPDPKPLTNHYSPMLHNVVVANALTYADTDALKDRALQERFIQKAKNCLDAEAQKPALSGVLSLNLLSTYYTGQAEQSLGFMYFGALATTRTTPH